MNWIKKIISFFKRKKFKKIDSPEIKKSIDKKEFSNSLKVNTINNKKKEVETRICEENGLGIQKKIIFW